MRWAWRLRSSPRQQDIPQGVKESLNDLEREWFVGRQAGRKSWVCRRVELNAMSAPQLVAFIEAKLAEHGATAKVLPSDDVVATHAEELYRGLAEKLAEERIKEILDIPSLVAMVMKEAGEADFAGLLEKVAEKLAANPPESWRDLVDAEASRAAQCALERVHWDTVLAGSPKPPRQ